ncbi:MAG: hypothetical protein EBR82_41735 [Caulobacteraceae bacterium]|nr:hypothetical protein [Caulobacteraceae bacterium]
MSDTPTPFDGTIHPAGTPNQITADDWIAGRLAPRKLLSAEELDILKASMLLRLHWPQVHQIFDHITALTAENERLLKLSHQLYDVNYELKDKSDKAEAESARIKGRLDGISRACHGYLNDIGSKWPGETREESERKSHAWFVSEVTKYAFEPQAAQAKAIIAHITEEPKP